MDLFKLEDLTIIDAADEQAGEDKGAKAEATSDSSPMLEKEDGVMRTAEAEIKVTQQQYNYMPGTFHGGAIAVSAEEIARRCPPSFAAASSTPPHDPRVRYIEVHYMSPIKHRAALAAVSTASPGPGPQVTRVGLSEAGGEGRGRLCAEAVLHWG